MTDTISTESGVTVESFSGKIESAYGRKLSENKFKEGHAPVSSLDYDAEYEKLGDYKSIPKDELPNEDDILGVVNAARKANARQKAMQKALDKAGVIKPTMESDVELQIASMVKGMVASGKFTEEAARQTARQMLGA